jgi:hypothetical protein
MSIDDGPLALTTQRERVARVRRTRLARVVGFFVFVFFVAATARAQSIDPRNDADVHAHAPVQGALGPVASSSNVEVSASTEVAMYADSDHVFVFTPSIAGSLGNLAAGWSLSGSYLVDVVSAASADIVSTASPPFLEARQVGTLRGSYKPGAVGVAVNVAGSFEPDYTSVVGGVALTADLFDRRVAVLFGYSHLHDIAGRAGTSLSAFSHVLDRDAFKAGATFVVDRATTVALVGDVLIEYGDPSKPYRYVPLFAPGVTVPAGASVDEVNAARLSERALEQLPLTRQRYALTMRWAHRFDRSTLRLDERAYADSWGLKATTTDARWLFDVGRRVVLGPHLRFYGQSRVDFWQRTYTLDPTFGYPSLRTGNRELGSLVNLMGGASVRLDLGDRASPWKWTLGFDLDLIDTQYLDDIYLAQRFAGVGSISLEVSK